MEKAQNGGEDLSVVQLRLEKQNKKSRIIEKSWAYIFALLPLIGFVIFSIFPIAVSFIAMFCDIDIYNLSDITWNNFEGFKLVFDRAYSSTAVVHVTELFVHSIGITFWIASTQLITLCIALIISVLLHSVTKGAKVFQVLYFIPYICSSVAVALMWKWVFSNETFGILNTIFGTDIRWTENENTVTWCIIVATIWQAPGYGIVMYKAALGNVNKSLYEAASLDGANAFNKFWHVTLPAIAPTTFYLLMAGIMAGLGTFDMALLIIPDTWTDVGGAGHNGLTMMRLIYYLMDAGKVNKEYVSTAAIISWVLFIITGTLSMIVMHQRNKRVGE